MTHSESKLYIINSPILTKFGEWRFEGPLTLEQTRAILTEDYVSAIGHSATAQFLEQLIGLNIPANRIRIEMNVGDRALVLQLKTRLEEGRLLSVNELHEIPYDLGLLTRLS